MDNFKRITETEVVTELFGAPARVLEPAPRVDAPALIANWFQYPVKTASVVTQCGRMALIEYELIRDTDPDIVLMIGLRSSTVNRVTLELQDFRARHSDVQTWYTYAQEIVLKLVRALAIVGATDEEAALALGWAGAIRDGFRTLNQTRSATYF